MNGPHVATAAPRAASGYPSPGLIRSLRSSRVVQAGVGMVLLQLGFRAWVVYGSWFHIDDFNYISRMVHDGPTLATASQPYFGHVRPAGMYLSWLNHVVAPWNWALPATEILLLQLVADLALLHLLLKLFGPRPAILAGLAVYLFSSLNVPSSMWWVSAESYLPMTIALFVAMAAHLRYLRTSALGHAVVANLVVVGGLLFNEKTILVYALLGLATLAWFAKGSLGQRIRTVLTRDRWGFVLYALTGAAYTAWTLTGSFTAEYGAQQQHDAPLGQVLSNLGLRGFLVGIWGGPLRWTHLPGEAESLPAPGDLGVLLALVVTALLVRELWLTRRGWLPALLIPAFFVLVDVLLVLNARAAFVGALISLNYRYIVELPAIVAIALPAALVPVLGTTSVIERQRSELFDHPHRAAAAVAVVACLGIGSSIGYAVHWQAYRKPERYITNLSSALDSQHGRVDVVDTAVPPFVTHGFHYPENTLSHLFADRRDVLRFPVAATDHLFVVDSSGRLRPAVVPPVRSGVDGRRRGCGHRVGAKGRTIPLDGPVSYGGWWVRIGYLSTAGSPVRVTTGDVTRQATVQPGVHALYVKGAGTFDSVKISGLQGKAHLCTDDITVGRPQPATMGAS